jgi:hypothetical protein
MVRFFTAEFGAAIVKCERQRDIHVSSITVKPESGVKVVPEMCLEALLTVV